MAECYLRSLDARHPDILIKDLQPFQLGRGPLTKIKDSKCSRCQVELTADFTAFTVKCVQKGGNPSTVANTLLKVSDEKILKHKDELVLPPSQYRYCILFNPEPNYPSDQEKENSVPAPSTTEKDNKTEITKRKRLSDSGDESNKRCNVDRRENIETPWFKLEKAKCFKSKENHEWSKIYDGKLLILNYRDSKPSEKIAAFDIDGTIITTKSGKVFATDQHDWRLLYSEVPGKLKQLAKEGYRIVFVTNQAGIAKGKVKESDFMEKVENIVRKINIPILVLCSTAERGFFRKPRTGIWLWLSNIDNQSHTINMDKSFYCGDAAGRRVNWMVKKKKDFSCSDRLFAMNLNLSFFTPEEYFLEHKATKLYDLPGFNPRDVFSSSLLEPDSEKLVSTSQEMVVMVGIQGSGKSHLSEKLENKGYVVASNDRSGGKDKTLRICRDALSSGKSLVVDNTHRDKQSRKDYISLARDKNIPVRCFWMTTSHDQARHNNLYRELTDPRHVKINDVLFNSYRSHFEEPEECEEFSKIVRANFLPEFPDTTHQNLYKMFLLEK